VLIEPDLTDITSGGHALIGSQTGNVYTAYADVDGSGTINAGDTAVFTITVAPGGGTTGTYTFDLLQPLDGDTVDVPIGGSSSFGAGPTLGQILEDAVGNDLSVLSGYTTSGSFSFNTWFSTGNLSAATVDPAGVNGSVAGWGVEDNNFGNPDEIMYFDFGSQALSDPDGSDSFTPPSTTLPNISYATFDFINYKGGAGNAGDDIAYVVQFTDGTSVSGFIPDQYLDGSSHSAATNWTFTAPDGKFIADIQFYSGVNPDGSVQDLAPGKIDLVSVGVQSTTTDVTIPVDMTFTDADGDTVTGSTTIHVVDGGTATTPNATVNTLMATNSTESADSSHLMSSTLVSTNDNHRSAEEHRAANYSTLLGAVAAAGLASANQAAAESFHGHDVSRGVHTAPIMAPQADAHVSASQAPSADASLQSNHVVAGGHEMATTHLSSLSDGGRSHGLAGQDHGGHQAVTQLLHGTESHAMSHGPAPVAAAASIAIPSAEMLAAHMGAGAAKGGVDTAQAAASGVHPNADVGKVLADALAGGHGHGANIDALLHNAVGHGHGTAQDALAALASHDAGAVSIGHSGVFAGFHNAPIMEQMMMHQDAPAAHS